MRSTMRGQVVLLLLAIFAAGLLSRVGNAEIPLTVKTDKGAVEGAATQDGRVISFKGIPFGAPPVGQLRWQPPAPADAWTKPLNAKHFGHRCFQSDGYNDMTFHDSGASEDCLNLNVWAPADARPGSLPVMVWVYGGGFVTGGTSEYRQDGQWLAHHGVVVVSMNYRLGIFGFLSLPTLTAESPHHASGNYGLMDQAAALAWVKRNIANFGGDPKKVTVFGESAGSFAVSTLMASPLSKDLFQRAIGESGGAFGRGGLAYQPLAERESRDAAFLDKAFGTSDVGRLRDIAADDILRAVISPTARPGAVGGRAPVEPPATQRFGPSIDGYFLPESVEAIYAAGRQAHVPLLAGWNADEGRGQILSAKPPVTSASFKAQAEKEFGARSSKFLALYPATSDEEARNAAADYAGDRFIAFSTWRWIEAQAKTGDAPVYRYFFTLGSPGDNNHEAAMGAFHSDEIEYVFGVLDSRSGAKWRPEDRRLSEEMIEYWTNFARTGNPNGPGLPDWPKYSPPDWRTMKLGATSQADPDTYRARYQFLEEADRSK